MKEKILAQLVIKFPGVSKKFLGLWADKLTPKVTDETQIEGVVNELDNLPISITDLAAELQKEGDTRVSDAKKEWLTKPPKHSNPPKTETPPKEPEKTEDEEPAWFKAYREQTDAKISAFEKEKTVGSIKQKLTEKLKDIPASIWSKRALPEKEEDMEAFITEVEQDYQADFITPGLITNPASGAGGKVSNGKATKEEIKGIVDRIMPK